MGLPVPALRQPQRTALADEITTLYAHINSATCRLLELIADFDGQGLFVYFNALSTAHWLNWACGIGPAAAREKVRVARALGELTQIQAAFRAGTVSYSKVRAITRVASPANEGTLLDMARHATAAQIERIVRNYRTALCLEQPGSEPAASRSLSVAWDPDGCLVFKGRLSPDQGALFLKALERSVEDLENPEDARPVWERQRDYPLAARRADALVGLAEQGLAEGGRGGSSAERFQVNVYVSAETPGLHAGTPIPDCDWRPPDYQHIAWWMVNYMARE
jgi:hypothetical protein